MRISDALPHEMGSAPIADRKNRELRSKRCVFPALRIFWDSPKRNGTISPSLPLPSLKVQGEGPGMG